MKLQRNSQELGSASTVVLSMRNINPFVGWVPIDEFEDIFVNVTNGSIFAPSPQTATSSFFTKCRSRLQKASRKVPNSPEVDLLLVVARSPADLRLLESMPQWRRKFRYVAAFIIDAFHLEAYPQTTRFFDHIFVTTESSAEYINKKYGVPCSVLRQGMDCLRWASLNKRRSIDLFGMGRQPSSYHRAFQKEFHRHDSSVLYLNSPIGAREGKDIWIERPMFLKVLQQTKILLAFHLLFEPMGNRPRSMMLTSRWFEGLTTGCIIVGKHPTGSMVEEMLDWPNSTFELPDNKKNAIHFIKELLGNQILIDETRKRNVLEMVHRHDWRYRIETIMNTFNLEVNPLLREDLSQLSDLGKDIAKMKTRLSP